MDPPHVTEFASQRYFDKLKKLRETSEPSASGSTSHDGGSAVLTQTSQFILPIGRPKTPDHVHPSWDAPRPIEKKRHHFSFRSILPTRTATEHEHRRLSTETPPPNAKKVKSIPFNELFLALPNELKIQIISSLPLSDVLNLRLASKSWHALVTLHELPIARYHLNHHIPAYAKRLYPAPEASSVNFHYLCGIWHRLHVATKLAFYIHEWLTTDIFLRSTPAQQADFAPQKERMRRRLIPILFTVFHFFETYRDAHVQYIKDHGHGLSREPHTLNPIEAKIMNMYDDQTLLQVHQVFPLIIAAFCRRLRPPSYVGRVEKSLRGYLKDKPSDEIYAAALCIGGMRQVERFWEIKGYNTRRGAVDTWYDGVRQPVESVALTSTTTSTSTKPRRGFMGLSRKKSSFNVKEARTTHDDSVPPLPPLTATVSRGEPIGRRTSDISMAGMDSTWEKFVFSTSLSAGMPMSGLPVEDLSLLLPDLPVLQQIWLPTAEALILDRGIVERPQDIKRNQAVLLDLIREDASFEDEWWYGAIGSVQPPLEAVGDESLE